ncbi:MAG: aminotransferase class V-fold PLP-dependent enzyme [Bacteroidetes bacterium]|nr:aminotransferase class V-fold PLP-dependent enzyme [Bacteroidota bacterium]
MRNYKDLFLLDSEITYLNFGSFGACPKPIFETYQDWQLKLERSPVHFIVDEAIKELENVRKKLGEYIGANFQDIVMVTNPSYAINTIAKAFPLKQGDEILSTNLEYGACDRVWEYYCEKAGAIYIKQEISLPLESKESFLIEFWKGFSKNTKAVYISHITSATGLILPIEEICIEAKKRGLITIIDGAHVPGHLQLNLSQLEADIYTGACHKWMMGPKGSSFLYVNKENQDWVDPLLISWGYKSEFPSDSNFIDFHQTSGTRDYAAFLTVSKCIHFMAENNWESVSNICKKETLSQGIHLTELLKSSFLAPLTSEFYGQLFSVPIKTSEPTKLKELLFEKYKIEIPIILQNGNSYLRFSYQAFNNSDDMAVLYKAIEELIKNGNIIAAK